MRRLALTVLMIAIGLAIGTVGAQERWDVIVVGSEPEAIAAAVTAAEEGAKTLLVTEHERLGGLFVRGALNVLDVRTDPFSYQQGFFARWWARVGGGHAFEVVRAERTFERWLAEAGVPVVRGRPEPILASADPSTDAATSVSDGGTPRVVGVRVDGVVYLAAHIVDGTADADLSAAAGATSTIGFSSLGYPERMADTLVFRVDGVDWAALRRGIQSRGKSYASIDDRVAWGSFGGVPTEYVPRDPSLRLRGLNVGRDGGDGTVWINALLIYGIDPFDPASRADGYARALAEAPHVVAYLRDRIPGFGRATFGGTADALYVRETRHLVAECILTADDVLDNRVTPAAIAAGGYPLDVQTLTPFDSGFVFGVPEIYGVELCVTVPQSVDGLWVVGRSAGFDPIAHASARVVPLGMAVAEAVGVAAARAAEQGTLPRDVVRDSEAVTAVRDRLADRGAYVPVPRPRDPVGPVAHPYYDAFRTLLARGLAVGGYANDPRLDAPVTTLGYVYLLSNVGQRFLDAPELGRTLVASHGGLDAPLDGERAMEITAAAGCALGRCADALGWTALASAGLAPPDFRPAGAVLTRGEMYALAASIASLAKR